MDPKQALTAEAIAEKTRELEEALAKCYGDEQAVHVDSAKKLAAIKTRKAELREQLATWKRVNDALADLTGSRPKVTTEQILEILRDGAEHSFDDLASHFGVHKTAVIARLGPPLRKGEVVKVRTNVIRLAPVSQQPATVAAQTIRAPLEPIRGTPPSARCPVCSPPRQVLAIGTRDGRYVFKCTHCGQSFRQAQ